MHIKNININLIKFNRKIMINIYNYIYYISGHIAMVLMDVIMKK